VDDARAELERAAEDPRARASALLQVGILELQEGRPTKAIAPLREARAMRPRDTNLLNALGEAYHQSGRSAEAVEAWRASLALDGGQDAVRGRIESTGAAPR
jgi:Flp pilus assembly protein TadD